MTRWLIDALTNWNYYGGFVWAMIGYEVGWLRPLRERWSCAD